MGLITCKDCEKEISKNAQACPNCGAPVLHSAKYEDKNFANIEREIKTKAKVDIDSDKMKPFKWLALTNAAIIFTLIVITGGEASVGLILVVIGMGATVPFIMLFLSKWLAIRSHKIRVITDDSFRNEAEKQLLNIVRVLSSRAGLETTPEVGIYDSDDMNAFATGRNRENSLIAFSSQLLSKMDEDAISAVAAHEIAHIANGDMVTMTIVQAAVNAIVLIITLPLMALKLVALFSEDFSFGEYIIVSIVKFIVVTIVLFLGNLVTKAFSRKREFEADKFAATILDSKRMVHALNSLNSQEEISFPSEQAAYASFKISSPPAILDVFSTHPSLERRINALEALNP